jgi:hypothetical protein
MEVVLLSKLDVPTINQEDLAAAWQQALPNYLHESDQAKVMQEEAKPKWMRVHIDTAGRSFYSFDFDVTYMDSREVKVEFIAAYQDKKLIDEKKEPIQGMIKDYVRHIHECAQALQSITHS